MRPVATARHVVMVSLEGSAVPPRKEVESEKQHPQHEVGSAESHMPDPIGAQPGADGWELELRRSLL